MRMRKEKERRESIVLAKIFAKQKRAEETRVSWCIFNVAYLAKERATKQHMRGGRG